MPTSLPCPSREVLHDLLQGRLADTEADQVARHVQECDRCSADLDSLQADDPLQEPAPRATAGRAGPEPNLIQRLQNFQSEMALASAESAAPDGADWGRVGHYRIRKQLGAGGMGVVFLAEDERLQRPVALKVMRPELASYEPARQRFLREARAMAALRCDHVVTIHEVGQEGDTPFLAMEYLPGESLAQRLARPPALTLAEVVRIGRETALGLAAAHERGLIHRDIKPGNLFLTTVGSGTAALANGEMPSAENRVKILDFGLARSIDASAALTQTGRIVGTPAYMALEQARGGAVDSRADLYSLGCVLYELCTGRRPVQGKDPVQVVYALLHETPPPIRTLNPHVPPDLADLITLLLARDAAARPASAGAVVAALEAIAAALTAGDAGQAVPAPVGETLPARGTTPAQSPGPSTPHLVPDLSRRHWLAAAGLGALAAAGIGGWAWYRRMSAAVPTAPAFAGWIDVRIWSKAGQDRRNLGLADFGVLPLRVNDEIRIEAEVAPAGYLYVFWIDTEGRVDPLYPWKAGSWGTRPAQEQPRTRLDLPETATRAWPIRGPETGMETLLLLVRETPLPLDDAALQALLAGLPPQRPVQDFRAAVWFENGQVVRHEERRRPAFYDETEVNDPVLRLQQLIREKLQPHAAYIRAVSFAKQGQ